MKQLIELLADAGQEGFVGGELSDVTFLVHNTELGVKREVVEVKRKGAPHRHFKARNTRPVYIF